MILVKVYVNPTDFGNVADSSELEAAIQQLRLELAKSLSYNLTGGNRRIEMQQGEIFVVRLNTLGTVTNDDPSTPRLLFDIEAEHFNDRSIRRDQIVRAAQELLARELPNTTCLVRLALGNVTYWPRATNPTQ